LPSSLFGQLSAAVSSSFAWSPAASPAASKRHRELLYYCGPALVFVALYSYLPHKVRSNVSFRYQAALIMIRYRNSASSSLRFLYSHSRRRSRQTCSSRPRRAAAWAPRRPLALPKPAPS
jgi:hypothetical protein